MSNRKVKGGIHAANISLGELKERQDITNEQIERMDTLSKRTYWITIGALVIAVIGLFISVSNILLYVYY